MGTESIESSFLSIFALISFFIFLLISKFFPIELKVEFYLTMNFQNHKLFMILL